MPNKNTVRYDYLIIKRISQNDYPNKTILMDLLIKPNEDPVSERTFQRIMKSIRDTYDIEVGYDRIKRGYYINTNSASDWDKIMYFVGLAETSEIVFSAIKDKNQLLKHISIGPNTDVKGVGNIGIILRAIKNQTVVEYSYISRKRTTPIPHTVYPYLLKEFDGMWDLFAYLKKVNSFRTYRLDRMRSINTLDERFEREKRHEEVLEKFEDVYGVKYSDNKGKDFPREEVKLKFNSIKIHDLSANPLHYSQEIDDNNIVTLRLAINAELKSKILSYGTNVKVLAPESLIKNITHTLTTALKKYK